MTTKITAIPGIGKVTEKILKESGYSRIDDLVNASIDKLSELHGFGPVRARQIISLARKVAEQDASPQPDNSVDSPPPEAPAKKKNKGKKDKAKDKKKDKKKNKKDKNKGKKKKNRKKKK